MKNLTSTLSRLSVVLASVVALASCNRAQYATLPRSTSYLGTTSVASVPRPVAAPVAAAPVAPEAPTAPIVAAAPGAAGAPAAPEAPVAAAAPAAPGAPVAPVASQAKAATPAAAPARLPLVQRLALAKVTKKINKLAAKTPQFKQRDATASINRGGISGNLRTGIILLIVGVLVGLLNGLIGTIIAIIGLVFIILWLLDQA